jgi:SAM-dependent methyltransferase
MINSIFMKLRPVAKGFDPISSGGAEKYAAYEWANLNTRVIDDLEQRLGGLAGKRVLDLGAGPGQYAVEFARRGANVTWFDISRQYLAVAQGKAADLGTTLDFGLGYMEEAKQYLDRPFDFVFNRICWFYCANDRKFARLIHGLIRPGGCAYIDNYLRDASGKFDPRYWLNAQIGLKIGHPAPPPGRLEKLFHAYRDLDLEMVVRTPRAERMFLTRRDPAMASPAS